MVKDRSHIISHERSLTDHLIQIAAPFCVAGGPFCVAGVVQSHIHLRFTWQAWHNLTSAFVLRGRRGTHGTGWRAWAGLVADDAAALCVAGVAQSHIHLRFTWQAWHNLTSAFVSRGRRGISCLYMPTVLLQLWVLRHVTKDIVTTPRFQNRQLLWLTEKRLRSFQNHIMPLPQSDTRCSAGVAGSGHPIKAPVCSLSHLFNTFALLLSRVWVLGQTLFLPGAVSGPRINFVNVGGWAAPIWWWRYVGRANCSASPATTQTGRCVRAALREAAESSIAGSRPRRCAGWLFVPCALLHTSHRCSRRPRSLHSDSTLWQRRGGSFCMFLFSRANHGSMPYRLVVGVIAGTLPIFISPTRTWWCSRGQDSASWFPRMDLTLFSSSLPATSRPQWTFVWSSVRQLPPLRLTDRSLAPVRSTTSASFRFSCLEIWIGFNWETLIFGAQTVR